MGCGAKTIKYLLFFFNLLFALGGLAILTCGAIIQWKLNVYGDFFTTEVIVPSIILIVAGSMIFIISFFGCCGAIRESHCMVITFAILLLVIFILQVVGGILAFVYRADIQEQLRSTMLSSMLEYNKGSESTQTWDNIHQDFECCGVDNFTDWMLHARLPAPPESCRCQEPILTPGCEAGFYSNGCYTKVSEFVRVSEIVLGAVAIGIALVELIGVIFALVLANAIKNQSL